MSSLDWSKEDFCHVGNSAEVLKEKIPGNLKVKLFLTDPPYNIGHKYGNVSDRLKKEEYQLMIKKVLKSSYEVADDSAHFFMIHYPETIAGMWKMITEETGWKFKQWITWAYPSNIGMSKKAWTRASRTVLWLIKDEGGAPTFHPNRIIRPYRNPWDKRVAQLIKDGKKGCSLYDWWEINLTKNVNKEKSDYSNQIPQTLLKRVIRSTTNVGDIVADPFAGTFSTVKAALATGRLGWGCDLNDETMMYWPENIDFRNDYEEEEYSIDLQELFDVVRANISNKSLNSLIRRACENDMLPPSQKKWTLRELDFIESEDGKKEKREKPSLDDW
jgi:adenine-specific DNA-methyltransferase